MESANLPRFLYFANACTTGKTATSHSKKNICRHCNNR